MSAPASILLALLGALAPAALSAAPRAPAPPQITLGLCPDEATGRLDSYMQALCDGETALRAGDPRAAIERFRHAASLPRIDATNELSWAGIAAAHCQARDFGAARLWQGHFAQARQLWLGQLDCDASENDARGRLSPFVRSRMCGPTLSADYALARTDPETPHAVDLKARLDRIAEALAQSCAATTASTPAAAAEQARKPVSKNAKAKQKRKAKKSTVVRSKASRAN